MIIHTVARDIEEALDRHHNRDATIVGESLVETGTYRIYDATLSDGNILRVTIKSSKAVTLPHSSIINRDRHL